MKGWRTLLLNLGIALLGVLEVTDWASILGGDKAGLMVTAVAVANIVLRSLTTTAIGSQT
jgi:hypothetical protein